MADMQSLVAHLWWLPVVGLLSAAGCITVALSNAYRGLWLWLHRNTPISDPVVAKAVAGVRPPPYAIYAAAWFVAGIVLAGLTAMVWH